MLKETWTNLSCEFYHNFTEILLHLQTDPCPGKIEICSKTLYIVWLIDKIIPFLYLIVTDFAGLNDNFQKTFRADSSDTKNRSEDSQVKGDRAFV